MLPKVRANCPEELPEILNMLGNASYDLSEYDQANQYFSESLETASKSNNLADIAFASSYLGNICRLQGNFPEAKLWFEKGLSGYQQLGDIVELHLSHLGRRRFRSRR